MINRFWCFAVSGALALFTLFAPLLAQEPYYKDKTIRIMVGASPGGIFDGNSRIVARHIVKHIPGNPTVTIENVPGAGGLIVANRLYKAVKADGLTMGHFNGGLVMGQLLGNPGIEFDAAKFQWVGVPVKLYTVCVLTRASGITNLQGWMNSPKPVRIGATGPGSDTYDVPKVLEAALQLPIHIVAGYKGAAEIRLAAEGRELDGVCWGSDTASKFWAKALETGEVNVVVQGVPRALPELPKVPLAIDFAKSQEARRLIEVGLHDQSAIRLPYALPPGTPKEAVQIMRQALMQTLKDSEFLADAKKAQLTIEPVSGEELERIMTGISRLEPALVSRLKTILVPAK